MISAQSHLTYSCCPSISDSLQRRRKKDSDKTGLAEETTLTHLITRVPDPDQICTNPGTRRGLVKKTQLQKSHPTVPLRFITIHYRSSLNEK